MASLNKQPEITITTTPAKKFAKKQATPKKASCAPKRGAAHIVKEEPIAKRNFDASPLSDANFMINLSPALRRAQTAFVNFDQ